MDLEALLLAQQSHSIVSSFVQSTTQQLSPFPHTKLEIPMTKENDNFALHMQ
jgi:hypothetical protein